MQIWSKLHVYSFQILFINLNKSYYIIFYSIFNLSSWSVGTIKSKKYLVRVYQETPINSVSAVTQVACDLHFLQEIFILNIQTLSGTQFPLVLRLIMINIFLLLVVGAVNQELWKSCNSKYSFVVYLVWPLVKSPPWIIKINPWWHGGMAILYINEVLFLMLCSNLFPLKEQS